MKAGGTQLTQLFILPNGLVDKWVPGEGKQWKVECDSGPVSRHNGLLSTTSIKANVTGDECPQLCTAITCANTLPYHFIEKVMEVGLV